MTNLELLAPARNADIGIAAIDCGADAVYIAGPDFGARVAAWNNFEDIARLCEYAHKFGARIFLTVNTTIEGCAEREKAHNIALAGQDAGVDALIVRDPVIASWADIHIPKHASTQCAIRTPERAKMFEDLGCSRLILERQLSLEQIRDIRRAVGCELEFFVHGALCVGYSGQCRLSQYLDGRSADKGDCIQACRSLYDLQDANGKILVRNKPLLSLRDYTLKDRLEELADAGISSFKIEGRLKSASYVKNVTREYSLALDKLVGKHPESYCRASFGSVSGGFEPALEKTFNRGYTELFLDGKRGDWASESTKSLGEKVGTVLDVKNSGNGIKEITLKPSATGLSLHNGDGFTFVAKDCVCGFRADTCNNLHIRCRCDAEIEKGTTLYRNVNTAFERELESNMPKREIPVRLDVRIDRNLIVQVMAESSDGRKVVRTFDFAGEMASNIKRAEEMLKDGLSKRCEHYIFSVASVSAEAWPLLQSAKVNSIRRAIASDLNTLPCESKQLKSAERRERKEESMNKEGELMRSKYCIRFQLGMCPVHQGAKESGPLFLVNNGRRLLLGFDCGHCEMTVSPERI